MATVTITEEQLAALVAREVAKQNGSARDTSDAPVALPLSRQDLAEAHEIVRAFVALAAAVGQPHDPNGSTPFEVALKALLSPPDYRSVDDEE